MKRLGILTVVGLLLMVMMPAPAGASSHCIPTGYGTLTANYVNTDIVGITVDVDCDVGAFFDEDGVVDGATFKGTFDNAQSRQYGVLVVGADVDVRNSNFDVEVDYPGQWVGTAHREGATGVVADNEMTGFKRAGILVDGAGSSATVRGNTVIGVGPKSSGWAENGIQISRGATGVVSQNVVKDHWWDLNNFVSSGIIVVGSDDVTVQHNTLAGNDAALAIAGDRNNVSNNDVDATADGTSIFHAGAIVYGGTDNALVNNTFTSGSPDGSFNFGIFVVGGSDNTKLIRNSITGFNTPLVDQGDDSKLPDPFAP